MLRKLLGFAKPAPPSLPPEDRARVPVTAVVDVTDADFDAVIAATPGPALVDFWAEWCQPCDIVSAQVEQLAKDYRGRVLVTALDVDENPAITERFGVMGLPTLLFLRDGVEVNRHVGLLTNDELRGHLDALLSDSLLSDQADTHGTTE